MTRHLTPGRLIAATLAAIFLLFTALRLLTGCAGLTPGQRDALVVADEVACAGLALVPVVGASLAAACVGSEGEVRAALDHAVLAQADGGAPPIVDAAMVRGMPWPQKDAGPGAEAPSPGAVAPTTASRVSPQPTPAPTLAQPRPTDTPVVACARRGGAPLYRRHGRHHRHVGCVRLEHVEAAQGHLDAMGESDAGAER